MPIEIRAKGLPTYPIDTVRAHQGPYYGGLFPAPGEKVDVEPGVLEAAARAHEAAGYDSILVPQANAAGDVWTTAAWALAATRRIRIAAAHRVGLQLPTQAAKAYANLHALSGGRAAVHMIQGNEDDLRREGEFLDKKSRYRRSGEYLEIFHRSLHGAEPFDFQGEFYAVQGAWLSTRLPAAPVISLSGASPQGIALAARYADVYGLYSLPLQQTRQTLQTLRSAAAAHGRTIRFWRDSNFILADTDEQAWRLARSLADQLRQRLAGGNAPFPRRAAPASTGHQLIVAAAAAGEQHDRALFTGISQLRNGWGPAFVGSPETAAAAVLDYYELGVEAFSLGLPQATPHDLALRDELIARLRAGAVAIDARHGASSQAPTSSLS
ncbi:LLM class flavin-dependent oxidoreductase [Xylophilus sp.]|uniref:LLM class flavin-dependent oxidoreductase n=1 Tax=Xylophilus sp. TaxID=2653893 RepID=UPI0013BAF8DD|nr:LLM class flavin-dependent oxidoreductase [Xylophilus sp.]KAF1044196.1 MAG: Alkanesulfonate monooxygenase [Xylophilus sp.]